MLAVTPDGDRGPSSPLGTLWREVRAHWARGARPAGGSWQPLLPGFLPPAGPGAASPFHTPPREGHLEHPEHMEKGLLGSPLTHRAAE